MSALWLDEPPTWARLVAAFVLLLIASWGWQSLRAAGDRPARPVVIVTPDLGPDHSAVRLGGTSGPLDDPAQTP